VVEHATYVERIIEKLIALWGLLNSDISFSGPPGRVAGKPPGYYVPRPSTKQRPDEQPDKEPDREPEYNTNLYLAIDGETVVSPTSEREAGASGITELGWEDPHPELVNASEQELAEQRQRTKEAQQRQRNKEAQQQREKEAQQRREGGMGK